LVLKVKVEYFVFKGKGRNIGTVDMVVVAKIFYLGLESVLKVKVVNKSSLKARVEYREGSGSKENTRFINSFVSLFSYTRN
jgi:hypothetical protein